MSFGYIVNDAVNWIAEEIKRSIDDIDETIASQNDDFRQNAVYNKRPNSNKCMYNPPDCIIPVESLSSWQEEGFESNYPHCELSETSTNANTPTDSIQPSNVCFEKNLKDENIPFPVDKSINSKLHMYEGDLLSLTTSAILCFTRDGFHFSDPVARRLLKIAGEELENEVSIQDACRAGEVRMCRLFNLPSTHVIYTVLPRFTCKYITATHNALNSSIREALLLLKEKNLRSIAIPCLKVEKTHNNNVTESTNVDHNAISELGGENCIIHTVLRSLRRWMEKLKVDIDSIVLVTPDAYATATYRTLLKAYFPRNRQEENSAIYLLPKEIGNENGEIDVAERRIRVIRKATEKSDSREYGGMIESFNDSDDSDDNDIVDSTDVSFLVARSETETEKRIESFSDSRHRRRQWNEDNSEKLYQSYLKQANNISEAELSKLKFIYPAGKDNAGRPVIVFLAAAFPATSVDSYILLLHIIKTMDPYIRDKYTLLYVNTEVHHSNTPSMSLWSEFFGIMNKYENNLDQLLVLHPGILFKAAFTCCWPYLSSNVWNGTVYLESLKELAIHLVDPPSRLPKYVLEYDTLPKKTIFGIRI